MQPEKHRKTTRLAALAPPSLVLLLLIASSGFDLLPELGVFNAKRLLEPLVLGGAFMVCLVNRQVRTEFAAQCGRIPHLFTAGILAVFFLGLVSALRFPNPGYGLADISLLGLIAVTIPLMAACRRLAGSPFDRVVLGLLAMLGLVVATTELTGLVAGWSAGREFGFNEMLVRFAHPRLYNQLQSWTLPLLAGIPLVFGAGRRYRIIAVILLGFQWLILLMSGGRGSFLALVTSLTVLALLVRGGRRSWLPIHAAGVVVGLVLFAGVLAGHAQLAPAGGEFVEKSVGRSMTHSTGRTLMWRLALEDAKANPWLGAGPMRFNCDGPGIWPAHPHSFPMRLLSEWGIPAFAIVLALFLWAAIGLARELRRGAENPGPERELHVLLAAAVLAASLHACLSGVLTMPASQLMAVILCGWLLALTPGFQSRHPAAIRKYAPALGIAALVACAGLSWFNVHELRHYVARVEILAKAGPVQPRYWQHGRACMYTGY